MYRPDDKDIDRLSRDAAEHYHAPGQPSWDALQQILDKELPQEKEKKRRGFFFFFFLLLGISVAGSGIWFGLGIIRNKNKTIALSHKSAATENKADKPVAGPSESTTASNQQNDVPASAPATSAANHVSKNAVVTAGSKTTTDEMAKNKPAKTTAIPAAAHAASSQPVTSKTYKPVLIVAAKNKTAITKNTIAANDDIGSSAPRIKNNNLLPASKKIKAGTPVSKDETMPATVKNKPVYTATAGKKIHHNSVADKYAVAASTTVKNNTYKGNKASIKPVRTPETAGASASGITANTTDNKTIIEGDVVVPATSKNEEQPPAAVQDTIAGVTVVKPATPDQPVIKTGKKDTAIVVKKKHSSNSAKAINIGLTAGIDESTVKFTNGDNIGYNFGIMGGYQFNKHWSVYTGVIYTKKNYELNGSDYHPPKHYWTMYVDLQSVEGYCRMWEVPLLARYTFNPGAKTAYFASAGLSSYFMKRQDYTYTYKNMMGNMALANWASDSTFNHVFSVLHLSAGFEKSFGKHMNWQIEPYAKIPLGGVGFGSIRLSSFGVNLSVQYRRPVKR